MKAAKKRCGRKAAFTIVELLTVMSIIIVLIGLLVPALNQVKKFARDVRQKAQFHSIDVALELFNSMNEGYPPSGQQDPAGAAYCGAMKLAEAMAGQDLQGFHPDSTFRRDGTNGINFIYDDYDTPAVFDPNPLDPSVNLQHRKSYLQVENANAYRLSSLWVPTAADRVDVFDEDSFVLCDVYASVDNRGTEGKSKIGMPILYYKANITKIAHDPNSAFLSDNIYNYEDNIDLVALNPPRTPSEPHILNVTEFYALTRNDKVSTGAFNRPYRLDSYILISAGYDGLYGTPDDILNFEK